MSIHARNALTAGSAYATPEQPGLDTAYATPEQPGLDTALELAYWCNNDLERATRLIRYLIDQAEVGYMPAKWIIDHMEKA